MISLNRGAIVDAVMQGRGINLPYGRLVPGLNWFQNEAECFRPPEAEIRPGRSARPGLRLLA
ncbi:MAG: hypothetical protein ABIP29_09600, partial [Candidatus Eisenbacteria bacterium]